MAVMHASMKTISRSAGRSAVAAVAYRSGTEITDERTGLTHDYTRKGGVVHTEVLLPDGATADRAVLWNAVEAKHKRGDALVAREIELALPAELTDAQRRFTEDEAGYINALAGFSIAKAALERDAGVGLPES